MISSAAVADQLPISEKQKTDAGIDQAGAQDLAAGAWQEIDKLRTADVPAAGNVADQAIGQSVDKSKDGNPVTNGVLDFAADDIYAPRSSDATLRKPDALPKTDEANSAVTGDTTDGALPKIAKPDKDGLIAPPEVREGLTDPPTIDEFVAKKFDKEPTFAPMDENGDRVPLSKGSPLDFNPPMTADAVAAPNDLAFSYKQGDNVSAIRAADTEQKTTFALDDQQKVTSRTSINRTTNETETVQFGEDGKPIQRLLSTDGKEPAAAPILDPSETAISTFDDNGQLAQVSLAGKDRTTDFNLKDGDVKYKTVTDKIPTDAAINAGGTQITTTSYDLGEKTGFSTKSFDKDGHQLGWRLESQDSMQAVEYNEAGEVVSLETADNLGNHSKEVRYDDRTEKMESTNNESEKSISWQMKMLDGSEQQIMNIDYMKGTSSLIIARNDGSSYSRLDSKDSLEIATKDASGKVVVESTDKKSGRIMRTQDGKQYFEWTT